MKCDDVVDFDKPEVKALVDKLFAEAEGETSPVYISHGLNGVYLCEFDKWIRLDARGNRSDVDAQFSVDEEKLAFPVRAEKGEEDDLTVYADPKDFVIKSMRESKTRTELWINFPVSEDIELNEPKEQSRC